MACVRRFRAPIRRDDQIPQPFKTAQQVVPRAHIHNAVTLRKENLPLLDYMKSVGEKVLKVRAPAAAEAQFVFHVAPFNSIDHLHLHCQALPFTSWWSSAKYRAGTRWCWTFDQVRRHMEEERPIP